MQRDMIALAFGGRLLHRSLLVLLACLGVPACASADDTYVYAVQVSAEVRESPTEIRLSWRADPFGATNYIVYRKSKEETSWGAPVAILPGASTSYTDTSPVVGEAYEYQIQKLASLGYKGYGYIFSGVNVRLVEDRGVVLLVIASESVSGLEAELNRLETDLVGDGWEVRRIVVSKDDTPEAVRLQIRGHYWADPDRVKTVFLLGHVPVLQSGWLDYDGHGARPMPADAFYGDVYDDWPTAPNSSPSYLPSDVVLQVGRVDLADMPGAGAVVPWPSETELLRNYLNKSHRWRHKLLTAPRTALMGNRRGDEGGLAVAASGYRAFEPLVGPGTVYEANIANVAPTGQRWSSLLASGSYLFAYGCGAGQVTAVSHLGTHGTSAEVWSTDLVGQNAKAVFVMMFGSHFGNWDRRDNIMRAVLATPETGLAAFMSGEPHWFIHHMGLGETIGYSTRLTMNNGIFYQNQLNRFMRAVYIAMMGDPTLRLDPVSPPGWITASRSGDRVSLTWGPASEPVVGYHVYRAGTLSGPFTRLTPSLLADNAFEDASVPPGEWAYMVRAVALTRTPSGTYFNASQGVFATVTVPAIPPEITLRCQVEAGAVILSWSSRAGVVYEVQASDSLNGTWTGVSGHVQANGDTTSWRDPAAAESPARFYRITAFY